MYAVLLLTSVSSLVVCRSRLPSLTSRLKVLSLKRFSTSLRSFRSKALRSAVSLLNMPSLSLAFRTRSRRTSTSGNDSDLVNLTLLVSSTLTLNQRSCSFPSTRTLRISDLTFRFPVLYVSLI